MRQKHLLHILPSFAARGLQVRFLLFLRLHGNDYGHSLIE
jgi:hypothetical protein